MMNNRFHAASALTGPGAWRALRWVFIGVLALQLLIATLHNHDASKEHAADCVACVLVAQTGGGAPAATPPVFVAAVLLAITLAVRARSVFIPVFSRHLLPLPHAPPFFS